MKKLTNEFVFDVYSLLSLYDASARSVEHEIDMRRVAPPLPTLISLPEGGLPAYATTLDVVHLDKELGPALDGPDIVHITSIYDVN